MPNTSNLSTYKNILGSTLNSLSPSIEIDSLEASIKKLNGYLATDKALCAKHCKRLANSIIQSHQAKFRIKQYRLYIHYIKQLPGLASLISNEKGFQAESEALFQTYQAELNQANHNTLFDFNSNIDSLPELSVEEKDAYKQQFSTLTKETRNRVSPIFPVSDLGELIVNELKSLLANSAAMLTQYKNSQKYENAANEEEQSLAEILSINEIENDIKDYQNDIQEYTKEIASLNEQVERLKDSIISSTPSLKIFSHLLEDKNSIEKSYELKELDYRELSPLGSGEKYNPKKLFNGLELLVDGQNQQKIIDYNTFIRLIDNLEQGIKNDKRLKWAYHENLLFKQLIDIIFEYANHEKKLRSAYLWDWIATFFQRLKTDWTIKNERFYEIAEFTKILINAVNQEESIEDLKKDFLAHKACAHLQKGCFFYEKTTKLLHNTDPDNSIIIPHTFISKDELQQKNAESQKRVIKLEQKMGEIEEKCATIQSLLLNFMNQQDTGNSKKRHSHSAKGAKNRARNARFATSLLLKGIIPKPQKNEEGAFEAENEVKVANNKH